MLKGLSTSVPELSRHSTPIALVPQLAIEHEALGENAPPIGVIITLALGVVAFAMLTV